MNKEEMKKWLSLMEYGMEPTSMPGAIEQDRETENVSYSKTKSKGDASVTISANAKSMQELHDVLKLAGITLPKDKEMDMEPEQEVCPQCGDPDCTCEPGSCDCGSEDQSAGPIDSRYVTDKSALIDVIRQKLQQKLS
jgi:hypothetical protein